MDCLPCSQSTAIAPLDAADTPAVIGTRSSANRSPLSDVVMTHAVPAGSAPTAGNASHVSARHSHTPGCTVDGTHGPGTVAAAVATVVAM